MATLIGVTVPGLEAEAASLLRRRHRLPAKPGDHGAVLVPVAGPPHGPAASRAVVRLNRRCRCLHRVGLHLAAGRLERLDDSYRMTRSVELEPLMRPDRPFAIRASRRGRHDFGSPDVGRCVGQAVIDRYREATGSRLPVDLEEPDVILRAEVHDDRFRLWLDTTGDETLAARRYRLRHHPAGLDPCLARLLLEVAGWRGQPVLDPMCGSGTIPVEAALLRLGVPAWRQRPGGWAWQRLAWMAEASRGTDPGDARDFGPGEPDEALAERPARDPDTPEAPGTASPDEARVDRRPMMGIEISPRHVQTAWRTVAAAGVAGHVRVILGDATELDRLVEVPGTYPLAVLNPPFGRRMGSPRKVERLYEAFCAAAARAGVERLVVLVELAELLEAALASAGYALRRRLPVRQGDLDVHVLYAERG